MLISFFSVCLKIPDRFIFILNYRCTSTVIKNDFKFLPICGRGESRYKLQFQNRNPYSWSTFKRIWQSTYSCIHTNTYQLTSNFELCYVFQRGEQLNLQKIVLDYVETQKKSYFRLLLKRSYFLHQWAASVNMNIPYSNF